MDDHGNLLFTKKDWFEPKQIKSLFAPWLKKPWQKRKVSENAFGGELTEEEESEEEEDNEMLENIVENTTSMTHPVVYQNIDLCEKRGTLARYGDKK